MINLQQISKSYNKGTVPAVKNISFHAQKGDLFGLIGPDGAGKTTLFRILTTLLLPDEGTATVAGFDTVNDYKEIRSRVGYMPGRFSLYQDLTVEENLEFFATVFDTTISKNYYLIKDIYVQLEPFKNRRAGNLSGGMKQKLALCCALIHKPEVLFLDEPTTGVDAVSRREFWEMLSRLKAQGITILVSTPYMDEAALCEKIALIQEGSILSVGTPSEITRSFGEPLYSINASAGLPLIEFLDDHLDVSTVNTFGEYLHVTLTPLTAPSKVEEDLRLAGFLQPELVKIVPAIEDCFIKLMEAHHE